MHKVTATEAAKRFGELLDQAQHGPVLIKKQGRPVAVMYSYKDAQALETLRELSASMTNSESNNSHHNAHFINKFPESSNS